jgi:RNA polymerase sigma-B factor
VAVEQPAARDTALEDAVNPARHTETQLSALHERYWQTKEPALEARLVQHYEPLAASMARRIAFREDSDDAHQVARFGLMMAVRRFDPQRGVAFSSFAWATISGELKRFMRDCGWSVRVERRLQEGHLRVIALRDELRGSLGREPSEQELSDGSGLGLSGTREAIGATGARRSLSIHALSGPDDGTIEDTLGGPDAGYTDTDDAEQVGRLLGHLPELDRALMRGYWFDGRTQHELATEHRVSQMQVSRLLRRSLDRLRGLSPATDPA